MGRVLFPHPSLIIGAHDVMAHWCFDSCHLVVWLVHQLKVDWLLPVLQGKHDTVWLALGHTVIWLAAGW